MKKNTFLVPGVFHDMPVHMVSYEWIKKFNSGKDVIGNYLHDDMKVYICDSLHFDYKKHVLGHELGHHILSTLKEFKNEENKCDLLGAYLIKLMDNRDEIYRNLKK